MARALALSGTALLGAALLVWSPQPTTGWNQSSAETTLWQLLNGDRVNNGLAPLTKHSTLVSLARWRSKDMVDRDYFDHVIKGTSYQVYHWYDLNHLAWSAGGENIGYNNGYSDSDSPIKINEGFMASAGHRANILNSAWTHGGVGAYGKDGAMWGGKIRNIRMYTELFMKAKASPPPPPPPTPPPPPPPTPKPVPRPTPRPTPHPTAVPTATPHQVPSETPAATPASTKKPKGNVAFLGVTTTLHAYVGNDGPSAPGALAVHSLRVQSTPAADRGIFETVIGSLLTFFLG
jgi:uncharacterized protein YkwD